MRELPRPTPTEVLAAVPLGIDDTAPPLPKAGPGGVREALERAILPALQRAPCGVSFSGGRDSSAILAVATNAARRHGLPEPVPVTMRFPDAPETEETRWQELVLEHLRLGGHEVVELTTELDALGTAATGALRRLGAHWPPNAYMHVPVAEAVRGGSLLTGAGGDEVFEARGARHVLVLRGAERPRLRDVRSFAGALLPRRVREARVRRHGAPYPWLTPRGEELVHAALAREEVAWPPRWDESMRFWFRTRAYSSLIAALPAALAGCDVQMSSPFYDPGVMAAMGEAGGATGFASRTAGMRELFADVLPDAALARSHKAVFVRPVWGPAMREFAAAWDGGGVDAGLVDSAALKREWDKPNPDARTLMLLHTAWLSASSS